MSSEVYCGDVCGEQHQVAVEGFVRVRTEEQPLDPCCMRQPTGVVEWAYLPLGEIVRSRDPGVHILCNRTASVDIFSFTSGLRGGM